MGTGYTAHDLASEIASLVRTADLTGYSNLRIGPRPVALTLYWHGDPPPELLGLLSDAGKRGLGTEILPAPYDHVTLRDAQIRLAEDDSLVRLGVFQISIAPDGSCLEVRVKGNVARVEAHPAVVNSPVYVRVEHGGGIVPC